MDPKHYVDCAVQTDGTSLTSACVQVDMHAASPCRMITAVDIRGEPTTLSELILSPPRSRHQSKSATQDQSAYIDQDTSAEADEPEDRPTDMTTIREYKRSAFASRFPKDRTLKSMSARIVSLPETTSVYSARKNMEKTARIVSQPERRKPLIYSDASSPFSDRLDISCDTLDPFVSEAHHRGRVRVRSNAADTPHTPSPPSSPESVIIIADKSQLPKGFLRNTLEVDDLSSPPADDDDWITWAKSPPRPIPALHGPLSLPYARCPSGAEGTIIEEQDNLPRMIWGLEGEEDHNHNRSASPAATNQLTRKFAPRLTHNVDHVPPRFQRMDDVQPPPAPVAARYPKPPAPQYIIQYEHQKPTVHKPASHADIDFSLPGHGPIDLSNVLRPRDSVAQPYIQQDDPRRESLVYEYDDVSGDWQGSLLVPDQPKSQTLPSSSSVEFGDYLTPSTSNSSLSSFQSLASSLPSVSLDSYGRLSLSNMTSQAPRRMSALEIAQNYRQQQIHHKSVLPTPPNSSSPIWASRFSPYQGSMISPDLVSGKQVLVQNYPHSELRQRNAVQQMPHTSSPVIDLNNLRSHLDVSSLAPAAHIQDHTSRETSNFTREGVVPENHLRVQRHTMHPLANIAHTSAVANTHSPAPPRPPPNTPMTVVSSRLDNRDGGRMRVVTIVEAPPSPSSPPGNRPRSVSHQQQRGLPLSQLLSRRLSSVPEEDTGVYADAIRASSPRLPTGPRPRSFSTGQALKSFRQEGLRDPQMMLVANAMLHSSLRTPSPGYERYSGSGPDTHILAGARGYQSSRPVKNRLPETAAAVKASGGQQQDSSNGASGRGRGGRGNRARGGGRGRRGHSRSSSIVTRNGPERVDGGMTVRS